MNSLGSNTAGHGFSGLRERYRLLFAGHRTQELAGQVLKLLRQEKGSSRALRFILLNLPGDTIFHHRALASFRSEHASVLFRLAEVCRDKGDLAGMNKFLDRYLRNGQDPLTIFCALCLTGKFSKAYASVPDLFKSATSAETVILVADPWLNIQDLRLLEPALSGVEAVMKNLHGPAKNLARLHRFCLAEKTGRRCSFKPPRLSRSAEVWLYLPAAEKLLDRLEFKKAENIFRAVVDSWPANELACGKLAETLFCSGRSDAALKLMLKKQRLIRSPGFRAWRGQLLLYAGRYKEAVKTLDGPIAAGNELGWCWRGAALCKLGRHKQALRDLDTAISINPDDLEARIWRAEVLRVLKMTAKAIEDLKRTLTVIPGHPWALADLALLFLLGREDKPAFRAAYSRLPECIKRACSQRSGKAEALTLLLEKLKGVRNHEPRFFHSLVLPANPHRKSRGSL